MRRICEQTSLFGSPASDPAAVAFGSNAAIRRIPPGGVEYGRVIGCDLHHSIFFVPLASGSTSQNALAIRG